MARPEASRYNIGAASRLSGVSREKIRIWERRYGAVTPTRDAGNHRLYSHSDVERLALIRNLVDRGQSISSVANLSLAQLKARTARPPTEPPTAVLPASALVVASAAGDLPGLLSQTGVADVARVRDPAAAEAWLEHHDAELVIAEVPTLLAGDLHALMRLRRHAPRSRVLVVFRFAPQPLLDQLRALGVHTVKAPLQPDDLDFQPPATPGAAAVDPRPRRYTPDELRRIAGLADRMLCECPRHLVDLISDLNAFEDYSLGCEVDSAADAAVHREIYDIVSRARTLVEDALTLVAEEQRAL